MEQRLNEHTLKKVHVPLLLCLLQKGKTDPAMRFGSCQDVTTSLHWADDSW